MVDHTDMLSLILNNVGAGIAILSSKRNVVLVNREMERIHQDLDWPRLQIGRKSPWENWPPCDRVYTTIHESTEVKMEARTFEEYKLSDGSSRFIEIRSNPIYLAGILQHIVIFFRDATHDKLFEQRLSAVTSSISTLIEQASAVIIGLDNQGYITSWNQYCEKVMGYKKEEVFAQKFSDLLHTTERKTFDELWQKRVFGKPVKNHEVRVHSKQGDELILLLSATVRLSQNNVPIGMVLVGQDVTELTHYRVSLEKIVQERTTELEKALQKEKEAIEAKSKFIAIVSHEFKSPIATINGEVEELYAMVRRNLDEKYDTAFTSVFERIKEQTTHMERMLKEVLKMKGRPVNLTANLTNVSIPQFVNRITEEMLIAFRASHRVHHTLHIQHSVMRSDERLLRNIFVNLLSNAFKFSPQESTIEFTVQELETRFSFVVSDQGIGIPPDDLPSLFRPFHRSGNVENIDGTGLGLSIVKRAVDLLEGRIDVESKLGVGTTFTVELPKSTL